LTDALKDDEEKTADDKAREVEEGMAKWEEDRDAEEEQADEDDPEKPNFEAMMDVQKEAIRTQREADEEFLTAFAEALVEKGVPVVQNLKTDMSAKFVFVKLLD